MKFLFKNPVNSFFCCCFVRLLVIFIFYLCVHSGKKQDKSKEVLFQESDSEQEEGDDVVGCFKIDDWISFTAEDTVLYAIAMLRIKFLALFSKHIQIPAKPWSLADDSIVQCIANILTKEEQAVGLTNPATKDIEKRLLFERRNDRFVFQCFNEKNGKMNR